MFTVFHLGLKTNVTEPESHSIETFNKTPMLANSANTEGTWQ